MSKSRIVTILMLLGVIINAVVTFLTTGHIDLSTLIPSLMAVIASFNERIQGGASTQGGQ